MKEIFFSVVVPTLNEEQYIPRLLDDFKKQQIQNFEVIIVDGHSEDRTQAVAKTFSSDFPLHVLQSEKRQVSVQRNLGASKAKANYIIFLDADSDVFPSFTKDLEEVIGMNKYLLIIPAVAYHENTLLKRIFAIVVNFLVMVSHAIGKPFSTGPSIIIEKNLFFHIGGFNKDLFMSEDHNLIKKAYAAGVKPKFARKIRVIFSLRRFKKEGPLTVLWEYILAVFYTFVKGGVKEKIFTYTMGGQEYKKP